MLIGMAYLPPSLAPPLPLGGPASEEQMPGSTYETMVGMESTTSINKHNASHGTPTTLKSLQQGNETQKQIPSVSKADIKNSQSQSSSSSGHQKGLRSRKLVIESTSAENTGDASSSKKKSMKMFSGKILGNVTANTKMSPAAAEMLNVSDRSLTLDALSGVAYNTQRRGTHNKHFPLHIEEDVALRSDYGTNETAITAPISDRTFQSSHYADSMNSSLMRSHGSSQRSSKFSSLMGGLRQESLRVLQEDQYGEEDETDEAEQYQKWAESIRLLQEETYHPSLKREEPYSPAYPTGISKKGGDRKGDMGSTLLCDPSLDSFFDIMYGTSDGAEKSQKGEEILWGAIEKLLVDSGCSVDSRESNDHDISKSTLHEPQLHLEKTRNWGEEAAKKQPALLKAVTFVSQNDASAKGKRHDDEVISPRDRSNKTGDADEYDRSVKKAKHALNNVMNVLVSTMESNDDDGGTTSSYQSQASAHVQELRQTMDAHQFSLHDLFRWSLRKGKRYFTFEEGISIGKSQSSVSTSATDQCVISDPDASDTRSTISESCDGKVITPSSGDSRQSEEESIPNIRKQQEPHVKMDHEVVTSATEVPNSPAPLRYSNEEGLVLDAEDEITEMSDASFTPRKKISRGSSDTSELARWLEKGFSSAGDESDLMNWAKSKSSSNSDNTSSRGAKSDKDCNTPSTGEKKSITFSPTLTVVAEGGYHRFSSSKLCQVNKDSKSDVFHSDFEAPAPLSRPDDKKLMPSRTARRRHSLEDEMVVHSTRKVTIVEEEDDRSSSSSSDPEIEIRSNVSSMVSSLTCSSFTLSQDDQTNSIRKDAEIHPTKEANSGVAVAVTTHVATSLSAETPVETENKDNHPRREQVRNIASTPAYPIFVDKVDKRNGSRPLDNSHATDGNKYVQETEGDAIVLNRRISEFDVLRERSSEILNEEEPDPANDPSTEVVEPVSYTFEGEQHIIVIDTGEDLEEAPDEGTLPDQELKPNRVNLRQCEKNLCFDRKESSGSLEERAAPANHDTDRKKGVNKPYDSGSSARSSRFLILAADDKSFRRIQKSRSIRIAEVVPVKNKNQPEENEKCKKITPNSVEYHNSQKRPPSIGPIAPIARATPVTNELKNDPSNRLGRKAPPDLGPAEEKQYLLFLEDEGSVLQNKARTTKNEHLAYDRYDMATVSSLENLFYANYPLGDVIEILPEEMNPLPTDEITIDSFVLAKSSGKTINMIQQPSHQSASQKEEKRRSFRRGSVGKFADSCLLFVRPAKNFCKVGARKIHKRNTRKNMMSYNEWKSGNQMK